LAVKPNHFGRSDSLWQRTHGEPSWCVLHPKGFSPEGSKRNANGIGGSELWNTESLPQSVRKEGFKDKGQGFAKGL
jgi:hypothetical protein